MSKANLYVFEGPDAVGKTTLASALVSHLHANGRPARFLAAPGRELGTLGRLVWEFHHDPERFGVVAVDQTSLQLMHIAAHVDTIEHRIRPALVQGEDVVMDRFWWSTLVYGIEQGVPRSSLELMIELELSHWGDLQPDIVFLVTRAQPLLAEISQTRFDMLTREYLTLAARNTSTVLIDNNGSIPAALEVIAEHTFSSNLSPDR